MNAVDVVHFMISEDVLQELQERKWNILVKQQLHAALECISTRCANSVAPATDSGDTQG